MDNLKNLRKELRAWGRYWASKETVGGYASKSNVERLRECCELGGVFSSDAHLFSHGSQGIKVPEHIEDMTKKVNQLSDNYRKVITGRYVKGFVGKS
ncbi:hypothetical protein CWC22_007280 [Pseudoalteromonas rubra]|uniref:Uncharacterized protein n=1 Tax=Pseudoalteromonas rubra TaxID=43658 RepID=A0A5S3UUP6_9GAMM|nr:hypothetical protein [Pseudoalteromonas rubra]QPB82809.1 hypothetical protein CWC22_007280 [Pseudoalteromonas rubra]